ncbi:MAG: methyltransferase domain-containing protein [Candidatus Aenigmatarchaeota archaeon]
MNYICLIGKDGYFVIKANENFNSHLGYIPKNKIKIGRKVKTHLGYEFFVVEATLKDLMEKVLNRMPQIITLKDLSILLSYTTLKQGCKIVDAGTGSGFSSIFFAYYLKPCKIYSYEIENKFIKVAKENIKICNLQKYIKIKKKDITKKIDEKNLDLVHLDMENSEKVIKHAYKSLKVGGYLAIFSPIIEQVIRIRKEIQKYNFKNITTIENIVREWQYEKYLRPKTTGILHTGFYTIARKC